MFDSVTPILSVRDFGVSVDYYVNKLGFSKEWEWGDPPGFGCVVRDNVCLFLCQGAQGQAGTWLSVFVDDVDAIYEEYKASGATIIQPPANFEWGMREMNVEDPDGHRLRIGTGTQQPADGTRLAED